MNNSMMTRLEKEKQFELTNDRETTGLIDTTDVNRMLDRTRTGVLAGFLSSGEPLIDISDNPSFLSVVARTCIPLKRDDIGREVVLLRVDGEGAPPIILGLIEPFFRAPELHTLLIKPEQLAADRQPARVRVDGNTVEFTAEREVVLRCGTASITLTKEGKIVIRGDYVISHAKGVNRMRGGSIELN